MNIIQIALLIGLIIGVVDKAYVYFSARNKQADEQDEKKVRKARNAFIWSLAVTVIYVCIKFA